MTNFYTDVIQRDARFTATLSCRDLALLEPTFRLKVQGILQRAQAAGTPMIVTETYRSVQRQEMLFAQHATELQTVGVHHYGLACDFAKLIGGEANWGGSWTFLGDLCSQVGCTWGGDWGEPSAPHTFRDYDHIQAIAVADQARLFDGSWYPG
jgi:hypothetical protein